MIYRKEEYVEEDDADAQFPIKQVDRLAALDGSEDRFIGRAALHIQTPVGVQQIPISFGIEADSVEDAFQSYAEQAGPKIDEVRQQLQERLEELRQKQRSQIVTPGGGSPSDARIIDINDLRGGS
jgi:hypothetical protein